MIDKSAFGKIVKTLRTNKEMTQEELTEKIDISKNYLSKVERGLSTMNAESFLKMAAVLEFNLEDFGIKLDKNMENDNTKRELVNLILSSTPESVQMYLEVFKTINKFWNK